MKRVLLRLAAALGLTAAATLALIYGTSSGDLRKVRASALLTLPDGGQDYRTLGVPVLLQSDGGVALPTEHAASCFASVRLGALTRAQGVACIDGGTPPPVRVQWVGGEHDAPSDCDDPEVCDDGEGVALVDGACAARGWPDAGDCLVGGEPAPFGTTLASGTWSGSGCVPRVCVVYATGAYPDPGWPDSAPLLLPDGGLIPSRTESPQ